MITVFALLGVFTIAIALALMSKPFIERWLAMQERKAEAMQTRHNRPPPPRQENVPPHLVLQAMAWDTKWAQEDALKYYQELYDEHRDWNIVMSIVVAQRKELQ